MEIARSNHKRLVAALLTKVGILPNLKGYHYLNAAVNRWLENKCYKVGICNFYKTLGKEFSVSAKSVESSIRHAIRLSQATYSKNSTREILSLPDESKPSTLSNMQFIALVANSVIYVGLSGERFCGSL